MFSHYFYGFTSTTSTLKLMEIITYPEMLMNQKRDLCTGICKLNLARTSKNVRNIRTADQPNDSHLWADLIQYDTNKML